MAKMRHTDHVRNSIENQSYHGAQQIVFQIKENAKKENLCTKGLKVLNKKEIIQKQLGHADAIVCWKDGPENWAYSVDTERCTQYLGISVSVEDGQMIAIYNL